MRQTIGLPIYDDGRGFEATGDVAGACCAIMIEVVGPGDARPCGGRQCLLSTHADISGSGCPSGSDSPLLYLGRVDRLRRWRDYWTLGVAVTLMLAVCIIGFAAVARVVVMGIAAVVGPNHPSLDDWYYISAIVWLPLSVGFAMPWVSYFLKPRLDAMNQVRRRKRY
jgi:hypothetical protein